MTTLFKRTDDCSTIVSLAESFDDRTKQLLRNYYPDWQAEIIPRKHGSSISLPANDEAEYCFVLYEHGGEKQIHAKRTQAAEGEYFYYYPFELAAYRGDDARLSADFNERLEIILSHNTRVRQRVGLIWASFHCEYFDDGRWKDLGGAGFVLRRMGFTLPTTPLYRTVYYRGPRALVKLKAAGQAS